MKREESIDYALRATWQAVARMYNEEAGKFGTTMATGLTLLSIDKEKGTPSTALGPKMGMEATSLSRIIKTMQDKGLIERKPNPNDGRSVLIYLTDFGKEKREVSKKVVLQFNEAIRNEVSAEKLAHFFEVTETINTLITERKIYSKS